MTSNMIKMKLIGADYAIQANNLTIRSRSCSGILDLLARDGFKFAAYGLLTLSKDPSNTIGSHFGLMASEALTGGDTDGIKMVITGELFEQAFKIGAVHFEA